MLQYFVVFFNISPPTKKSAIRRLRFCKQKCILTIKEENIYDVLTITLIELSFSLVIFKFQYFRTSKLEFLLCPEVLIEVQSVAMINTLFDIIP